MTRTQRWTLAVVCAATAMLMLDIAVVNTALAAAVATALLVRGPRRDDAAMAGDRSHGASLART